MPEPQAKRITAVKEQENINLSSTDNDDIIAKESSTDSESNLNTENQSEAEDANNSRNVKIDKSKNEAKESQQKTSKGQMKSNKCLPNQEAKTLSREFVEHWVVRF